MKILRLTTQSQNAIFDTSINDELLITPEAKIALQSLTLEQDDEFIVIDDTNDSFTYSVQNGQTTTINIPHQVVSFQNFNAFFSQFTRLLNNSINYNFTTPYNALLAMEWKVDTNTTKKVVIEHKKGAVNEHVEMWKVGADVDRQGTDVWGLYVDKGAFSMEDYIYNMMSPKIVSQGNGFLRCQVNKALFNAAGAPRNGFVIGLSKTNLGEITSAQFTQNMVDYGLSLNLTADGVGDYRIQQKGVFTDTGENLSYAGEGNDNNDYVEIVKNGSQIQAVIYDGGAGFTQTVVNIGAIESNVDLYPFIVFHNFTDYVSVRKVRTTISPFANQDDLAASQKVDQPILGVAGLGAPPMPTPGRTAQFINFDSIGLAEFLGFQNQRNPQSGTRLERNIQYIANEIFKPRFFVQSMIVEMLNLKLDSYDGLPTQEQRKSILAFVPQGNQDRITVYEPNNLNFIDLKNKEPLLLRNIKARIVQGDYSAVNLLGQASLVLLIDG